MNILALTVIIIFVIMILWSLNNDSGCRGSCEQGRKPCDCKDEE